MARISAALLERNPAVVVWDDAAAFFVIVVKLRGKDDGVRRGLGLLPRPWHGVAPVTPLIVENLSSVSPSVGNCPADEQPRNCVHKRHAAALCLGAQVRHDYANTLCAAVWPPIVHFCHHTIARAAWARSNAKRPAGQQSF